MYITPAQFRVKDYGVDVSSMLDVTLAGYLRRAAEDLHTFTCAPTLPVPHDFRGGAIVGESHTWPIDEYQRQPTRRVFPYHRPVIEVSQARLFATKTQYVEFSAAEIYYEPSEGWVEPVSANMTSYGLFGAAILPFVGLEEPHMVLDYTYGRDIPSAERIYYSDTGTTWRATIGSWRSGDDYPVTVTVNGTLIDEASYVVDYVEGTIRFTDDIPTEDDAVDVTFTGSLHPAIPEAQGLIAADRIASKALVSSGMTGLRRLTVAELTMERDMPRRGASDPEPDAIPLAAASLLEPFIFRSVAFA